MLKMIAKPDVRNPSLLHCQVSLTDQTLNTTVGDFSVDTHDHPNLQLTTNFGSKLFHWQRKLHMFVEIACLFYERLPKSI